jgi:hypothetical protein
MIQQNQENPGWLNKIAIGKEKNDIGN